MPVDPVKAALRAKYRTLRGVWTRQQREAMHRAMRSAVTSLPAFRDASSALLCYASLADEPDTWDVLRDAWNMGKTVALPRCESAGRMAFYRVHSARELRNGLFGIYEPSGRCPLYTPVPADLCIVPGLAFDRYGRRLGYGGGYYDRYLAAHPIMTVGLCYPNCFTDRLPSEPFDIPVQQVIVCNPGKEA